MRASAPRTLIVAVAVAWAAQITLACGPHMFTGLGPETGNHAEEGEAAELTAGASGSTDHDSQLDSGSAAEASEGSDGSQVDTASDVDTTGTSEGDESGSTQSVTSDEGDSASSSAASSSENSTSTSSDDFAGLFFDDFEYAGADDPELSGFAWSIREGVGHPGPKDAQWRTDNVAFPTHTIDGQERRVLEMLATTDGRRSTTQSEICHMLKLREGSYGAYMKFTDEPDEGSADDLPVQGFFARSQPSENDPDYSECDMEYLPRGGWGGSAALWVVTWESYQVEPEDHDNQVHTQPGSYAGWHLLTFTVADGEVEYFLDGAFVVRHGGDEYPESDMAVCFTQWFAGLSNERDDRSWSQQIDWVFHAEDVSLSPEEIVDEVEQLRDAGLVRHDALL